MMILMNWSWVATTDLVAERREHARELGDRLVHLLLGDAGADQRLVPSSDNIAVLFSMYVN